jgi:hypothetical protein
MRGIRDYRSAAATRRDHSIEREVLAFFCSSVAEASATTGRTFAITR